MTNTAPTDAPDADVLVAYATKRGSTTGIATMIADELRSRGLRVDLRPAADVADVRSYRLVVLGSAVYLGRWRPDAVRFLRRHAGQLRNRQVQLFQSGPCGPDAANPDEPEPAVVGRLRAAFHAGPPVTFGGMLDPATAHGLLARWMARGALGGDFRDETRIRGWAAGIAPA